jgi:hypothetical protein
MTDHIYGRANLLRKAYRPHMFISELKIYIAYLREQMPNVDWGDAKVVKYYRAFCKNMHDAVDYYVSLADRILASCAKDSERFVNELQEIRQEISDIETKGINT